MLTWLSTVILLAAATTLPPADISILLAAANVLPPADIINSGSTNTLGYAIHVERSGAVTVAMRDGAPPRSATIAPALATQFFAALDAAQPLGSAPSGGCMKSASFGYTLRVSYGTQSTSDLTCPASARDRQLAALVAQIAAGANVSNVTPRRFRD